MNIRKEVKVGLLVVISLLGFYYGYNYLKGAKFLKSGYFVYAEYSNINGLSIDDPVSVKGFKIGKVNRISYNVEKSNLLVELHIVNEDLPLPSNSEAIIVSPSLLGGKEVHIHMGEGNTFLSEDDTIKSGTEGDLLASLSNSLDPLQQSALKAIKSIDSTMRMLQTFLGEENQQNVNTGLKDLAGTLSNLNSASNDLEKLISDEKARISSIITNLNEMSENFSSFSDTLTELEIKRTIQDANLALSQANSILQKVDSGEGSIGQLVNNDTLYQNLESATKSLDKLLIDIEKNPKRYLHFSVFGGKNKPDK